MTQLRNQVQIQNQQPFPFVIANPHLPILDESRFPKDLPHYQISLLTRRPVEFRGPILSRPGAGHHLTDRPTVHARRDSVTPGAALMALGSHPLASARLFSMPDEQFDGPIFLDISNWTN
jgi:hypothetical protein